ncbi:MAG: STAS domain-containing protein [Actinomycetota bacterium]|nr:STAS domain-containing protein [Actinomycetota bacterium]
MSTPADLAVEQRDDVVVARIEGEIDRSNADDIADALFGAVPNMALGLVLDLSATTYIDSAGVHLLFGIANRLRRRQQQLRAVVPDGAHIARVLSVVALDRTVPLHPTVDGAVAGCHGQGEPAL